MGSLACVTRMAAQCAVPAVRGYTESIPLMNNIQSDEL